MNLSAKPLPSARSYAALSIIAAVMTIILKFGGYFLTGSVGLLSDAFESIVNLVAALAAFWALSYASKPPDAEHTFGHSKAEYFSSAVEGILILIAAVSIAVAAVERLIHPQPIEQVGLGLGLALVATAINGGVAWTLLQASRRLRSISLRADAHHLLTDVWTSVGVVLGIGLVSITGWEVLDPAIPAAEHQEILRIMSDYESQGVQFHAMRTRVAGTNRFVSFHVLVPGAWTVQRGHDLCESIEQAISLALPGTDITTHLEPAEDPISWDDIKLD
jgi:divalent metal cation (Fe/Co/Zn/Cd) transporter